LVQIINSTLILYSWIVAAILILFLLLIGRFYELKFGQRAHYRLMVVPLVCFLAAAIWCAFFARGEFVGVVGPDLLLLAGGISVIGLAYLLFRTMMGGGR
jgi:hypothetical protein